MKKIFSHSLVLALAVLAVSNVALFWKFYFHGQLPFPGNLLVSFYFPWNSGGFPGFDSWTTRKDVIAMDVIRQMYPWKTLAVDLLKQGQWPLWNPFNFAGTPLLANAQSSIFFPGTLLFLFLPYIDAWIAHVVLLPLLFSVFIYIYLRSLKLSNLAAVFGAIAASNISAVTVWSEQLIFIQTILFLPLILWAIERFDQTKRTIFLWLIPIFLAFGIFGGHPQTTVYVFLITLGYLFYKRVPRRLIGPIMIIGLGLAAIQLLPSLELYGNSAREVSATKDLFFTSALPWQNLTTILIPDFFGNPATGNFVGRDYGNFQAYFGVAALLLALVALIKTFRQQNMVLFFAALAAPGLIFSLPPFAYVFYYLKIPILSSGYPSRIIVIFQFAATILSAYGFDYLLKNRQPLGKRTWLGIILPALFFVGLATIALLHKFNIPLTKSYLLLMCLIWAGTVVAIKFHRLRLLLIAIAIFEYAYFFNKYQPFALGKFVFPPHPVFTYLEQNAGQDRFFGFDRAYVDNNFATYYRVFSAEGYDPLYIRRYGELLNSGKKGQLDREVPRSDAWIESKNTTNRDLIMNLLGIKYVIDKTDDPGVEWEPNLYMFPKDQYDMVWRINKWKIFARKSVLPRMFLANNYIVETDGNKIINRIYDKNFDSRQTLVLETDPKLSGLDNSTGSAAIAYYSPNVVKINTKASAPKLLFLSDSYYPGWQATVDGKFVEIFRADYTLRAIPIPAGEHAVVFEYQPWSFKVGAMVSGISMIILSLCLKKFYRT